MSDTPDTIEAVNGAVLSIEPADRLLVIKHPGGRVDHIQLGLNQLQQLVAWGTPTGGIIPEDMIANVGDRGQPVRWKNAIDIPLAGGHSARLMVYADGQGEISILDKIGNPVVDGTTLLTDEVHEIADLFSPYPADSFAAAWQAMMRGEVRERLHSEIHDLWLPCRIAEGTYQERAAHDGGSWHDQDLETSDINGQWRIPPPAEPERYTFAEALRLYQEQGAEGIRYKDWQRSLPYIVVKGDPTIPHMSVFEWPSGATFCPDPWCFTGADWELVPRGEK